MMYVCCVHAGYELVSGVSINEDWSAMRFRKVEHIKKMVRLTAGTLTDVGRERTADNKGPPGWAERAAAKKARDEAKAKAAATTVGKSPGRNTKRSASTVAAKNDMVVVDSGRRSKTQSNAADVPSSLKSTASKRSRSQPVVATDVETVVSATSSKRRRT